MARFMVVQSVSTRKVSVIVKELCGQGVSKSLDSGLCHSLDPAVAAWREQGLSARARQELAVILAEPRPKPPELSRV